MCFEEELQGLDIEIAKLIGKELSAQAGKTVDVHFKNMDFDGLIGSLQAEEIDLIAAAFSSTGLQGIRNVRCVALVTSAATSAAVR